MSGTEKVRVLVVHADSASRQELVRVLGQHALVEVVGSAMNGRTAVPKVVSYRPDCVLVGIDRNEGEELDLLAYLERSHPGVLRLAVTSAQTDAATLAAAQRMAGVDFVRREDLADERASLARLAQSVLSPLLRRVGGPAAGAVDPVVRQTPAPVPACSSAPVAASATTPRLASPTLALPTGRTPHVVGIGVSTGGPKALAQLLPQLPADFPLPIVVVQHMPPKFTKSLAESLDRTCQLRVREAEANDRLERGSILIAPGGLHMRVVGTDGNATVRLTQDPPECSCRPSVDYLFRSLVGVFGGRILGVVLTGMGEDGWLGSQAIRGAGGQVLAQDEATCTVYGMPRGPIEAGIAQAVPLDRMADAMLQTVRAVPCS